MPAKPTHSFFPSDMKITEIDRKIELIEIEIVQRKRGLGSPLMLALWKSIATDYRKAQAMQTPREPVRGQS